MNEKKMAAITKRQIKKNQTNKENKTQKKKEKKRKKKRKGKISTTRPSSMKVVLFGVAV